ncbi:ATP-binding protein [Sphingomonas sp. MMS12-HWE2-04]|uniref:ATP-binding protein n=1 Tax=Sphingomonas sp. MMS12-HWE2-04 TaxID=3234199 RepID=UPI00384CD8CE
MCVGAVLLIALLWAATLSSIGAERTRTIDAAIRENRNQSIAYEIYVSRTFDAADVAALHLAERFADLRADRPDAPPRLLDDPVAANPLFASVVVADAKGEVRWTSISGVPTMNISDRPGFSAFRDGKAQHPSFVGASEYSPYLRRAVFSVIRAIRRRDGSFGGEVIIRVPVERLTDFNRGAETHPQDLISVIRLDGITLARREGHTVSYGQNFAGTSVMKRQAANPNGSYFARTIQDGVPRYFSHRRLARYGVFVTTAVSEAKVLASAQARARVLLWAMAGLTLAILAFAYTVVHGLLRQQRGARAIAAGNQRLRDAQRIANMGDWDYDFRTDRMTLSEQLCVMYGRDLDDNVLSSSDAYALHGAETSDRLRAAVVAVLRTRLPQSCEFIVHLPGGGISYRRVVMAPVDGEAGEVRLLRGTEQDITREKLHEQLRDEVAHMARVEAVNVMAATIAHELAQPLSAASNYAAAAALAAQSSAQGEKDEVPGLLDQAIRQIGVTGQIIQRARDMMANSPALDGSAVLSEVVEDAIALVRVANRDCTASLTAQLDPRLSQVGADRIQVQQVLLNLLRNACQATATIADARVVVTSGLDGHGMVRLCVEDNGPGIAPGVGDIFSPFVTGTRGLGVGLSICRAIVQSYGGRIWSERSRFGGAAMCFTLPQARHEDAEAA